MSEGALGDEQEQALQDAFAGAAAAMLVEMARHTDLDRSLLGRLEEEFSAFFEDRQVAEILVGAALGTRALSVEQLRRRYRDLSFDPRALPISFDRAIGLLTDELARRVRDNARSGGALDRLVVVHDVEAIRGGLEHLIENRGRTGRRRAMERVYGTVCGALAAAGALAR